MSFIDKIKEEIKKDIKTVVLPESDDDRILEAAKIIKSEGLANVILIGDDYVNPKTYENREFLINKFMEIRNVSYDEAKDLVLNNYMYFSVMLVVCGYADCVVSGAAHSTADTLRPALQLLKKDTLASSFFIIESNRKDLGKDGMFLFADCALIQDPTSEELSMITKNTYDAYKSLIGDDPKVAMLSHSTLGSAKGVLVEKVVNATNIIKDKYPDIVIEGEVQADAALIEDIGKRKGISISNSNILIFPNIDAANISYKLVQIFGNTKAYGPIIEGLKAPVNDLSRGCSVDDIIGTVAITIYQTKNRS